MIYKAGKFVFFMRALFMEWSVAVFKDRNAFKTRTLLRDQKEENREAVKAERLKKHYILKSGEKTVFLSTAAPFFRWKGLSGEQRYYEARIPVKEKGYARAFYLSNRCPSGSSVSFSTDSDRIEIDVALKKILNSPAMSLTSTAGIDIYETINGEERWLGCYAPENSFQNRIRAGLCLGHSGVHEITVYLPLYSQVQLVEVGVGREARFYMSEKRRARAPVAIYGSSITQGCASSRPALSYANRLARNSGCEVYNFGFSGSARGEREIARYIATLSLSAVIMEYDHNADISRLKETHYNFYQTLRDGQPSVPVILLSRTSGGLSVSEDEEEIRYRIIKDTYERAKKSGDENVYLIRGNDLFDNKENYFVDDRHPNDCGMEVLSSKLSELLNRLNSD